MSAVGDARKRKERRADAEPVERLREAAEALRRFRIDRYDAALADLLDQEAARYVLVSDGEHADNLAAMFRPALAVADQILGEA